MNRTANISWGYGDFAHRQSQSLLANPSQTFSPKLLKHPHITTMKNETKPFIFHGIMPT
jgi:hypothetical protein